MRLYIRIAASTVALTFAAATAFAHADHHPQKAPTTELGKAPLGDVPAFALTDQDGKPFSLDALRGKVSIVDFVFTTCGDDCPLMTARMKGLQGALKDDPTVQFVSITSDPKVDDVGTLKRYAQNYKASEDSWRFLTGDKKAIVDLSVHGFKLPASMKSNAHTDKFVLIDGAARVRGYYESTDQAALARLAHDAKALAEK